MAKAKSRLVAADWRTYLYGASAFLQAANGLVITASLENREVGTVLVLRVGRFIGSSTIATPLGQMEVVIWD